MICFYTDDTALPAFDENRTIAWIKETAALYSKKSGRINYIFCSDRRILEINNQYLSHNYYTDIITFDYSLGSIISGDIFVGLETVKSNSNKEKTDFDEELRRVIIHGILHLCGQNDKKPDEKKEMTKQENMALARFEND
ncbi:MAG: rRNA maturation RNase YbeY [Paludibacteraceae bacterium]